MFNFLRDAAKDVSKGIGGLVVGAVELTGTGAVAASAFVLERAGKRHAARKTREIGSDITGAVTTGTRVVVEKAAVPFANMVVNGAITMAESTYKVGNGTFTAAFAKSGSVEQKAAVQEALSGATDLVIRGTVGVLFGAAVGTVADAIDGVDVDIQHVDGHGVGDYLRADGTHVTGYYRGEHLRHVGLVGQVSDSIAESIAPTVAGWVAAITAPTPAANAADKEADARQADREHARKYRRVQPAD